MVIPQKQSPSYARALAEKIVRMIPQNEAIEGLRGHLSDEIESLLRAALAEAKEEGRKSYGSAVTFNTFPVVDRVAEAKAAAQAELLSLPGNEWAERIRYAAYEECAKIVEDFNLPDGNEFYWYKQKYAAAEKIRSLCQR